MSRTHMSVKELAERWSCPLSSIYRQVETLKLPALRIGQGIRIPVAAIESFEASNTTGSVPAPVAAHKNGRQVGKHLTAN